MADSHHPSPPQTELIQRLASGRDLLTAWINLERERELLIQQLFTLRNSSEQIDALLEQNRKKHEALLADSEQWVNDLSLSSF